MSNLDAVEWKTRTKTKLTYSFSSLTPQGWLLRKTLVAMTSSHSKQNPVRSIPSIQRPDYSPFRCTTLGNGINEGKSKLQGKKQTENGPVILIWLFCHLLFSKRTSEDKTCISKLPPGISCLASLCPNSYRLALLCVWDEQKQSNCPLWMIFRPTLNSTFEKLCWNGPPYVRKRRMRTPPSCQCPRLSQTCACTRWNFLKWTETTSLINITVARQHQLEALFTSCLLTK